MSQQTYEENRRKYLALQVVMLKIKDLIDDYIKDCCPEISKEEKKKWSAN